MTERTTGTLHEECGVFGICGGPDTKDAGRDAYLALYALQHRGQESSGIAVNDDGVIKSYKGLGLVSEVLTPKAMRDLGPGRMAVGHVRYATTGSRSQSNAQPLVIDHIKGRMALCHNGNLTNAAALRHELELAGAIFHATTDSEVIAYIITRERLTAPSIEEAVSQAMKQLEGAYSLVIMSPRKVLAVRDPHGFRPLCIGKKDGGYVFASESCALGAIGAEFVRDVEPGEIVVAQDGTLRSLRTHCGTCNMSLCVFEYIYTARPDSVIDGNNVHLARRSAGAVLARLHRVEADLVIGVPDSGLDAAMGYSDESGIPYGVGLVKNRYIARTFIEPTQQQRERDVRIKLNPLPSTLAGKRVVLVDDSIVRGTTSARLVRQLRDAGAVEVHVRIAAPPFLYPCYFGTDVDSRENLVACHYTVDEIAGRIGADSLGYLPVENLKDMTYHNHCGICDACFTGKYPVAVPSAPEKLKFEQKLSEAKGESND